MNSKQFNIIKKHVLEFSGATLTSAGSFAVLKRGYMVSLQGSETRTTLKDFNKSILKRYIKLATKREAFIGLWLDKGVLYVDISVNIMKRETALSMAKNNNQLAIYDVINNVSIYTK